MSCHQGGIIALGIGAQGLSAASCVSLYRAICREGFKPKTFTKAPGLSWLARWFRGSIYKSDAMATVLDQTFGSTARTDEISVFGMSNHTRVAITTTVGDDCRLIANYNHGGSERYLHSARMRPWQAYDPPGSFSTPLPALFGKSAADMYVILCNRARCTSAAPLYFEPETCHGEECRDGGLKHNNPVQLGVNECKDIWHPDVAFDVILSVGSGRSRKQLQKPAPWKLLPEWLIGLFNTLMSTMDGEAAWERFIQGQEPRIRNRATRLNVKFPGDEAPALDDTSKIDSMERMAYGFEFSEARADLLDPFSPASGLFLHGHTLLEQLADQLWASMYFFQLVSIRKQKDIYSVTGWIGCRIQPGEGALLILLQRTEGFWVKGRELPMPYDAAFHNPGLHVPVEFNHQAIDDAIRIDVDFGETHRVSISGFPLTLRVSVAVPSHFI